VETLSPGDELELKITRNNDPTILKKIPLAARGISLKEIFLLRKFAAGKDITIADTERFDKLVPRLDQEWKLAQQALDSLNSDSYDALTALGQLTGNLPNHCETIFNVVTYALGEKSYDWDNVRKLLKDSRQLVNRLKKVELIGIGSGLEDWIYKELKPIILDSFSPDKDKSYNDINNLPYSVTCLWQWLLRICQYNKIYGKWWQGSLNMSDSASSTSTSTSQAAVPRRSSLPDDTNGNPMSSSDDMLNDSGVVEFDRDRDGWPLDDIKESKDIWEISFHEDQYDQIRAPMYDVTKWDTARVVYWLCKLNLSYARYVYDFVENAVDGTMLLNVIDDEILQRDLQVNNRLHRKNILNGINALKEKMNLGLVTGTTKNRQGEKRDFAKQTQVSLTPTPNSHDD